MEDLPQEIIDEIKAEDYTDPATYPDNIEPLSVQSNGGHEAVLVMGGSGPPYCTTIEIRIRGASPNFAKYIAQRLADSWNLNEP